jgi:hypothetical protein
MREVRRGWIADHLEELDENLTVPMVVVSKMSRETVPRASGILTGG